METRVLASPSLSAEEKMSAVATQPKSTPILIDGFNALTTYIRNRLQTIPDSATDIRFTGELWTSFTPYTEANRLQQADGSFLLGKTPPPDAFTYVHRTAASAPFRYRSIAGLLLRLEKLRLLMAEQSKLDRYQLRHNKVINSNPFPVYSHIATSLNALGHQLEVLRGDLSSPQKTFIQDPILTLCEIFFGEAIDSAPEFQLLGSFQNAEIVDSLVEYLKNPYSHSLSRNRRAAAHPTTDAFYESAALIQSLDQLKRELAKNTRSALYIEGQAAYLSGCALAEKLLLNPRKDELHSLVQRLKKISILVRYPHDIQTANDLMQAQRNAPTQKGWRALRFGSAVFGIVGCIAIGVLLGATLGLGATLAVGACVGGITGAFTGHAHRQITYFTRDTINKPAGSFAAAELGIFGKITEIVKKGRESVSAFKTSRKGLSREEAVEVRDGLRKGI